MKRFLRGITKRWSLGRLLFDDVPKAPVDRSVEQRRPQLTVIEGGNPRGSHC